MAPTQPLVVRRDAPNSALDRTLYQLLIALLVLVALGMVLAAWLFWLRHLRRTRRSPSAGQLPLYEKRQSGHRRLTISAMPYGKGRDSVIVYQEKRHLLASSPTSPVPEIRITFPDEVDESGKRQSGRVVVLRVGEHCVGMEPLYEDLPPYQRDSSDRFDSLDLDRIGGLTEKCSKDYS